MKPLNRPMFKYGGPIKEGIMTGMKSKPALVGDPVYPKGSDGRSQYGYGTAAAQFFGKISPFLKNVYQGVRTPTTFTPATEGIMSKVPQFIQKMLPSQRFRMVDKKIPMGGTGTTSGQLVPYGSAVDAGGKLTLKQVLTDPKRIGMAIRENKLLAASTPTLTYNTATTGGPILLDTAKGFANFLVPGTRFDPFGPKKDDIKTTGEGEIKRGGKTTNVGEVGTGGTGDSKSDAEKKQINEARIEENKQKYYKLMGIDKMNKEATYDSLIDASKIIAEKGGDLKGAIKSGDLQSSLISAISKNLDKSTDLKKQIDAAVLKAEITKDINLTKPSAFAEQVAYLRNNPNDPLARKLSGLTSVADNLAAVKTAELTSDLVQRLVESKGTDVSGTVKDDKYQKWEKNNEGKDEIDYIQENLQGIEPGVYIINKKAIQIKDGVATEVDLDSIIG
tara:strand:+ start:247 stop:1587 length:1341 start_codon:yes stop_codon:yes gene_type:complete